MGDTKSSRSNKLINNTALLAIGTIFTKGVSLIMVVLYSRWLSAGAYGDFELYVTYISLLLPLATLSCGEAVFRFLLEENELIERRQIVTTALGIAFCGFVLSILLLFVFARPFFTGYFFEFVFLFACETVFNLAQYSARGLHKLKYYTVASIINAAVMAITTTIFICVLNLEMRGLMYGHICGYIAGIIFCLATMGLQKYVRIGSFSRDEAKEIIKYSSPLIPNSIAWWIANGSDRTIVRIYLGSEYNGVYSIANKVPALCITLFNVFHLSWQESTSDALREDDDATEYFNKTFTHLLPTLCSVAIVVLSTNFFLFKFVFDPKYSSGYTHVAILTVATVLSFLSRFIGGIFIGMKKTAVNGVTTVMAAFINIIVDLALIRVIGLYAASVSTLVAYLFLFCVRFIILNKKYKLRVDKRSWIYTLLFCYFVASQYINTGVLNWINLAVAIAIFVFTNRHFIEGAIKKAKRKMRVK